MADTADPGRGFDAGELLRRARRIARLSQRELAERAGVPLATLARIESGTTADPRVRTLVALFEAMQCRLTAVSAATGRDLPVHPWENEQDYGGRHYPAHLDLFAVNRPYEIFGRADWWGWYRGWAWQRGARIPELTFNRLRGSYYCPPLDPATGLPCPPTEPDG